MPITLNGTTGEVFPSWTTATRPASPTAGQTGFNTTTKALETYDGTNWEITAATTSQGTSGQYLQSAGAGAAPTWATLSATGALIRAPQILTSGTSYTTPSNCTAIYVEAVGGGGNGGAISSSTGYSGGGGAGGYCAKYFTVTGSTAYTYAIGAATGDTTFTVGATTITANGGASGAAASGGSYTAGGAGGTGVNGDLNITGAKGWNALTGSLSGTGASSFFGAGAMGTVIGSNFAGTAATNYGAGGSGAGRSTSGSQSGGSGSQGVIRIWEYT